MQTVIRVLPVGPDGLQRVRIHFFVHDEAGPIHTPSGAHMSNMGPVRFPASSGYMACNPKLADLRGSVIAGVPETLVHSNDPRAATCPECLATQAYKDAMARLEEVISN